MSRLSNATSGFPANRGLSVSPCLRCLRCYGARAVRAAVRGGILHYCVRAFAANELPYSLERRWSAILLRPGRKPSCLWQWAHDHGGRTIPQHALLFAQTFDAAGRLATVGSSWSDLNHAGTLFNASSPTAYTPSSALWNWQLGAQLTIGRSYDPARLWVTGQKPQ